MAATLVSTDGYEWTPEGGLKTGLPTDAVIEPPQSDLNIATSYDVVVIGAGYAGLRALRDLCDKGQKVLLLEGRDRIGGRTWSVKKDGYIYELGGTWVHRNQAQVWTEIVRYGFDDKLKDSHEFHEGSRLPTVNLNGEIRETPITEDWGRGFEKFCNIDGQMGLSVFGLNTSHWYDNESFIAWDKMSCQDRLDQIADQLTEDETQEIIGLLSSLSKIPLSRPSFGEVLRWVSISGGTLNALGQHSSRWKLADGQTALARAMFEDAFSTGNLSYRFSTRVTGIRTVGGHTIVEIDGDSFKTTHVVVTVPLNCLKDIEFQPPLDPVKAEAVALGHTNDAYKVCVEASGKQWRNWAGNAFPDKGIPFLIGDGITPSGNTYLISTPGNYINPQESPDKLLEALQHFHPELDIRRVFGSDYFSDRFSKGGWAVHGPGFVTKYIKSLQRPSGNVYFANADWADLWRGFIDGALESGAQAALAINSQQLSRRP